MFLVLVRRSLTVHAAVLGAAISVYDLWIYYPPDGNWQQSVQDVTGMLVFTLPGLLLAAGLDGRRYLTDRHTSLVAGRRPWRALVTAIAASASWPALAMAMLLLTTLAVNARLGPYFDPGVWTLVLPFVFIAGYTAMGFLFGRYLPVVALVPAAPVAGYLAPALLQYTPDVPQALLSPVDSIPSDPPFLLQEHVVFAQVLIGLVILASIVAWLVLDRRTGVPSMIVRGGVVLALVSTVTALATADPDRHIWATDADGPKTCRSGSAVQVCVWTQHAELLPPMEKVANELVSAIGAGWHRRPVGLVEAGLKVPDGWLAVAPATPQSDGDTAYSFATSFVSLVVCGPGDFQPHLTAEVTDREQWLLVATGHLPVDYATERVQRLRDRPLARQRAWWIDLRQGAVQCTPR